MQWNKKILHIYTTKRQNFKKVFTNYNKCDIIKKIKHMKEWGGLLGITILHNR